MPFPTRRDLAAYKLLQLDPPELVQLVRASASSVPTVLDWSDGALEEVRPPFSALTRIAPLSLTDLK